jgi:hypothetical protein
MFPRASEFFYFMVLQLVLITNSLLFIDLLLVMINPFYSGKLRERKYITVLIVDFVVVFFVLIKLLGSHWDSEQFLGYSPDETFLKYWTNMLLGQWSLILLITIYVGFLLTRRGTSSDLKKKVMVRHFIYFFLFSCITFNSSRE